jgi:hypothetical protein
MEKSEQPEGRRVGVAVARDEEGNCQVYEHDLDADIRLHIATFHADSRTVPVPGEFGPELAIRDMAQIRAMIFVQTMEVLVKAGVVDLN